MKVVIFAGGFGTRILEETSLIPKPMVKVGEFPILWHIMKIYSHYGFNDFIICLGYKGYLIKEWFSNYFLHNSDITIDLKNNSRLIHNSNSEPWKVTLVETGLNTGTGGRIKKIRNYLDNSTFMLTYGDGLADIDINQLLKTHKESKKMVTVTAVRQPGRFGVLSLQENTVYGFKEKIEGDNNWINGGFFVLEPEIFNYLDDNFEVMWEQAPLETIASSGQLGAYFHNSFWKPMDKLIDQRKMEEMWFSGNAPWKIW